MASVDAVDRRTRCIDVRHLRAKRHKKEHPSSPRTNFVRIVSKTQNIQRTLVPVLSGAVLRDVVRFIIHSFTPLSSMLAYRKIMFLMPDQQRLKI